MANGGAKTPVIGWYGLGSMGIGMALNLQKHLKSQGSPSLHYSNRTLSRGKPLDAAGAIAEPDFVSVVRRSDVVFTMISNDAVLEQLSSEAVAAGPLAGKTFIDCSTVHPEAHAAASEKLGALGATFVGSPVFGASPVAAAGGLIFAMSGPQAAIDAVTPLVLGVMGRRIINLGPDVRNGSLLKIGGNILVVGFQELIAEAHVFAEKTGLGSDRLEQFIADMFGPVLESYSKRMTTGAYAPPLDQKPGFMVALASKDANHAVALARQHGTSLPTIDLALNRMGQAREYAGDSLDSASVYGVARLDAGLPFWNEKSRQGNE